MSDLTITISALDYFRFITCILSVLMGVYLASMIIYINNKINPRRSSKKYIEIVKVDGVELSLDQVLSAVIKGVKDAFNDSETN